MCNISVGNNFMTLNKRHINKVLGPLAFGFIAINNETLESGV
jgi:hypothetical protein